MTNAEKLLEAARLIQEVKRSMNAREKVCDCCGLKTKESWSQHQVAERLADLPTKLRRMAASDAITKSAAEPHLVPDAQPLSGEAT